MVGRLSSPHQPQRSDGRKDGGDSAQHAPTIGDMWEVVPSSIQSFLYSVRRGGVTLRTIPYQTSHLWRIEGSLRLIPVISLRLEPRASSSRNRAAVPTADSVYGRTVVYPGWYREAYSREVYTYQGSREAYIPGYTRVYTAQGGYPPPCIPGYTPPREATTLCTPTVVYFRVYQGGVIPQGVPGCVIPENSVKPLRRHL